MASAGAVREPCNIELGAEMELRAAIDEYLRFCAVERQLSEHTLQAYACDLADFHRGLPVGATLEDISPSALTKYLSALVSERRLAGATIRRRFACLRAFFRRLVECEHVSNPFSSWRLQLPRRKRLPRTLSRDEIVWLVRALRSDRHTCSSRSDNMLATSVFLMIATGIRVGELCKLSLDDVAPDGSSFRVHGKGSRDRTAYISDPELRGELKRLIAIRRQGCDSSQALFLNGRGVRIKPESIRQQLRRYVTEVGLARNVTPHMLRHTAATLLIETGVDIRFVQRLLGHASIATTEIYTHVSDQALRATLERADVLGTLVR